MRFFLLKSPKADSLEGRLGGITATISDTDVNCGPAPTCPTCRRFLGMLTWLPPYRVELEPWGRCWGDLTRLGDDLVVSDRFRNVVVEGSLKGIETFDPVEVVKVSRRWGIPENAVPTYYKATITRGSATIDQKASKYEWGDEAKICKECLYDTLKRVKRLVVKPDTWNGDDVFFPRGGIGPIVSERFVSMFQRNELRGGEFILSDSDEAGCDFFPWEAPAAKQD